MQIKMDITTHSVFHTYKGMVPTDKALRVVKTYSSPKVACGRVHDTLNALKHFDTIESILRKLMEDKEGFSIRQSHFGHYQLQHKVASNCYAQHLHYAELRNSQFSGLQLKLFSELTFYHDAYDDKIELAEKRFRVLFAKLSLRIIDETKEMFQEILKPLEYADHIFFPVGGRYAEGVIKSSSSPVG